MPRKMLSTVLVIIPGLFCALIGWYLLFDYIGIMIYAVAGLVLGLVCLLVLRSWLATEVFKIIGGAIGIIHWGNYWYADRRSGELHNRDPTSSRFNLWFDYNYDELDGHAVRIGQDFGTQ